MKKSDTVIRYILFYLSLILYFTILPIILSYSLGYHIDFRNFKIYKTGILALRSTPSGASLYINGKAYPDLTPARIEELKPDTYSVEVKREGFYPWQKELTIRPNMVTRAENIILFPMLQEMGLINNNETINFIVTEDRKQIYHMTKKGLYRSNMDGTNLKKLSDYSGWPDHIAGEAFSLDGKKFLFFNEHAIWAVNLAPVYQAASVVETARVEQVYKSAAAIKDAFWHSESNHIIFISGRDIDVLELGRGHEKDLVTLHRCAEPPKSVYYDGYEDSLYFTDTQDAGRDRLYKLDLREKFFDKLLQRVKKEFDIIYESREKRQAP